jgi:hypothetical protein
MDSCCLILLNALREHTRTAKTVGLATPVPDRRTRFEPGTVLKTPAMQNAEYRQCPVWGDFNICILNSAF